MSTKRKISAKEIVADIRSGVTNAQLMKKYQLSAHGLQGILEKLVNAEALLEIELAGRETPSAVTSVSSGSSLRDAARSYVMFRLPVYDLDDLTVEGHVHDISETGLLVMGLEAKVGDNKSLLIQADEFADVYPFTFDAVCRRVEKSEDEEEQTAAFEITSISEVGHVELRKLCQFLGLS
jgi:hypothetical protein